MASKCWFVLQQTHYPPPEVPNNGIGQTAGPICLGHLIPDLKHLDNVINRTGPLPIPPDMPIYLSKQYDLTWKSSETQGFGFSANAGAPIAAAVGVTLKGDAKSMFEHSVKNFWQFESLETSIIQPTPEYIEDSMEADEVAAYRSNRGLFSSSSVFMITGITVAKGAQGGASRAKNKEIGGGPCVEVPEIAEAGISSNLISASDVEMSANKSSDFVWAVRLAKISKGILDRKWSYETISKGATYGMDDEEPHLDNVLAALREEGLTVFEDIEGSRNHSDDFFFIGSA